MTMQAMGEDASLLTTVARELADTGRVQLPGFLPEGVALSLADCLERAVPWQLAHRADGVSRTSERGRYPDAATYAALAGRAYARARGEYQFLYDSYMLLKAAREGWDPGLPVHAILPYLNSTDFLAFSQAITGERIDRVNAQCTRYRPGQFLMPHEDLEVNEGRRYAYVINLNRTWLPDWGGQLQFLDNAGGVTRTMLPKWNTLSLFRVPQRHQVTMVAPWAGQDRLAVTGWFLADAPGMPDAPAGT